MDLIKALASIKRRILLLIGRAIVSAVDDSEGTQRLKLKLLADELAEGVERFQDYGFTSYPLSDCEALPVFLGGNRDHGIVLCVNDRRYRPTDLSEGECAAYTSEDKDTQDHRVYLKAGKKVILLTYVSLGCMDGAGRKLADERLIAAFNAHTHPGVDTGSGTTQVSATQLTLNNQFTSNTEAL